MANSSDTWLEKELKHIIINEPADSIRWFVAKEALSHDSSTMFFKELIESGCQSGMVKSLISYHQTRGFYDSHYEEIEELRHEYEYEGQTFYIPGDLKNHYAWLAFEEVAYLLADELGLEV